MHWNKCTSGLWLAFVGRIWQNVRSSPNALHLTRGGNGKVHATTTAAQLNSSVWISMCLKVFNNIAFSVGWCAASTHMPTQFDSDFQLVFGIWQGNDSLVFGKSAKNCCHSIGTWDHRALMNECFTVNIKVCILPSARVKAIRSAKGKSQPRISELHRFITALVSYIRKFIVWRFVFSRSK